MDQFSKYSIYVNRSKDNVLRAASRSEVLVDNKPWKKGAELWQQAIAAGKKLPLIFSHFEDLTFWAIATSITVSGRTTSFTFSGLQPIESRKRHDLVVVSTRARLPNSFIRSYAIVVTPRFLTNAAVLIPDNDEEALPVSGQQGETVSTPQIAIDYVTPPARINAQVTRVVRDTEMVRRLKRLHDHRCQRCGTRLELSNGSGYSEGHHLKPLGGKHRGPDIAANVLIVCPNCHALLDLCAVAVELSSLGRHSEHQVGREFLEYHNTLVRKTA